MVNESYLSTISYPAFVISYFVDFCCLEWDKIKISTLFDLYFPSYYRRLTLFETFLGHFYFVIWESAEITSPSFWTDCLLFFLMCWFFEFLYIWDINDIDICSWVHCSFVDLLIGLWWIKTLLNSVCCLCPTYVFWCPVVRYMLAYDCPPLCFPIEWVLCARHLCDLMRLHSRRVLCVTFIVTTWNSSHLKRFWLPVLWLSSFHTYCFLLPHHPLAPPLFIIIK